MGMKLTIQSTEEEEVECAVIKRPKENDIREELSREEFDFAILQKTPLTYIQCVRLTDTDRFILQYQDGSTDFHYENEKPVSRSRAVSALIWYLREDDSWLTEFVWERIVI